MPARSHPHLVAHNSNDSSGQDEANNLQQKLSPSLQSPPRVPVKLDRCHADGSDVPKIKHALPSQKLGHEYQATSSIQDTVNGSNNNFPIGGESSMSEIGSTNRKVAVKSATSAEYVLALRKRALESKQVIIGDPQGEHGLPQCLQDGDMMVITGVPSGSFIGYDTIGFNVDRDNQFGGVREIPPGPHLIYGGPMSEISTRNGFWIMSKQRAPGEPGDVFVRQWDKYTETLEDEVRAAEIQIQMDNLQSTYNTLLPYNIRATSVRGLSKLGISSQENLMHSDDHNTWGSLAFAIKGEILRRITGYSWNKWKVTSMDECSPTVSNSVSYQTQTQTKSVSTSVDNMTREGVLTFIFKPGSKTYSEMVLGPARSEQAMDSTSYVKAVIADSLTSKDPDELIGELQFCFLTGVLVGNVCCMEQWAHMIKILFKAFRFAVEEAHFFAKILDVFQAQLIYDDEFLQGSIFDHNHLLKDELKIVLTTFKSRLSEQLPVNSETLGAGEVELEKSFARLETWLWKWGWDLGSNYLRVGKIQLEDGEYVDAEMEELEAEDERGEYAPVVVELDERGREKGTIGW